MRPINLVDNLAKFTDHWAPRVVAEMNDYQLKVAKFLGDFVWHRHADTDEVFLVISGEMQVDFRDRSVTLRAGELLVVPRDVEHMTRANIECHALIIEPRGVANTGDNDGELTARNNVWV